MKKLNFLFLFFFTSIFLFIKAQDSDVAFVGNSSYTISSKEIKVEIQKIKNYDDEYRSGTLVLELYFSKNKYDGDNIEGYKVAEKKLGELGSGKKFKNIEFSTPWIKVPPRGEYYVTLLLLEYGDDDKYWIVDDVRFDNKRTVDF